MTPVFSSQVDHCPEEGRWGDCHSACLASLLDLPLDQVPLFFDGRPPAECWAHVAAFLLEYDLVQLDVPFSTDFSLDDVLLSMSHTARDAYYVLGVTSPGGHQHSVVCCGGDVVHDPTYPVDRDQYRPPEGPHWFAMFLVPAQLTRRRA